VDPVAEADAAAQPATTADPVVEASEDASAADAAVAE
jgi:hypothetical protein